MKKYCIIKQPAGFGDILFCQKIAKVFQENTEYKEIIWPVAPVYSFIQEYMGDENLHFPREDEDFPFKEVYESNSHSCLQSDQFLFIPLQTADYTISSCKCHGSRRDHGHIKYNFCNVDYLDWKDYLSFRRFENREDALIEYLGLDLNEPYNLINKSCGTPPRCEYRENIKPDNDYKNIYMDPLEGFSLFDWCKVFEHAQEIHTMETGVWYVLDKLGLENVYIYSKYTSDWNPEKHLPDDFSYMKDNCNPNWKLINQEILLNGMLTTT